MELCACVRECSLRPPCFGCGVCLPQSPASDLNMVGFCPFQRLLPAKAGVLLGDTEVDPTIVPHVEKMALTRVASFRQLQGPYLMFGVVGRGAGLPE